MERPIFHHRRERKALYSRKRRGENHTHTHARAHTPTAQGWGGGVDGAGIVQRL